MAPVAWVGLLALLAPGAAALRVSSGVEPKYMTKVSHGTGGWGIRGLI